MSLIVKNTTKNSILDWLCPHYCRGCGRLGSILCDCCKKNNIIKEKKVKINFDQKIFNHVWVCGWRDELLGQLIEEYKYQSVRIIKGVLVKVLNDNLPKINKEVMIVPLPTIRKHIRARGLDHTLDLARGLAKKRNWYYQRLLVREYNSVQVGASSSERQKQAQKAYRLQGKIDPKQTYLLLDDVWTTGASMHAAGRILRQAGAKKIIASTLVANRLNSDFNN